MFDKTDWDTKFNIEKVKHYILLALFFSIPLIPKIASILTILFVLTVLWRLRKLDIKQIKSNYDLPLYIAVYAMLLIGLLYTIDIDTGLSKVQTQISLLVFPLFLGGQHLSSEQRTAFMNSFVMGTVFTVILAFINAGVRYLKNNSSYVIDEWSRKHNIFFYDEFSKFLDLHPTYFSLYLGFALFYLIIVHYTKRKSMNFLKFGISLLLFVALFLTSSKAGIFSFLLLSIAFLIYKVFTTSRKNYIVLIAIMIIGTLAMFITNPMFAERSVQMISSIDKVFLGDEKVKESTGIRLNLWHLSLESAKEKLLLGHGTGSVFKILNENCIQYYSFSVCEGLRNKNSHNEYLNFVVSNGLMTVLIFIIAIIVGIRRAVRKRDVLLFFFIAFMTLNFLFESLLQRERGVLFYMLFLVMLTITKKPAKQI